MGDWIQENKYTASVITSIFFVIIFAFTVAKPYVDRKDTAIDKRIALNDSIYRKMLERSIQIQDTISKDIKIIINGQGK
jgi:hypothetical protein